MKTAQVPGDKEYNILRGNLQNFSTGKVTKFQIVIKDQIAVASFEDRSLARRMVKDDRRRGNKNVMYVERINSAVEKWPGKNKDEITKILSKKLKDGGAKLQK